MKAIQPIAEREPLRRAYLTNLAKNLFGAEKMGEWLDFKPEGLNGQSIFEYGIKSEEGFRRVEKAAQSTNPMGLAI